MPPRVRTRRFFIYEPNGLEIVAFDLCRSETHSDTCIATLHNVEEGSPVTDNIRPDPATLSVVLVTSQTPIIPDEQRRGGPTTVELETPTWKPPFDYSPGAVFREAAGLISGPQPETRTVEVFGFPQPIDFISETEQKLNRLQLSGKLVNFVTLSRVYEKLAITRVQLARQSLGHAEFSIDFQQVRLVKTAFVEAPEPLEPRGAPMQNKGQQAPKAVTPAEAAKMQKSDLLQLATDPTAFFKSLSGG